MPGATTIDHRSRKGERVARRFALLSGTTIQAPTVQKAFVRRAELLRRLDRERERALVLLTAPAGYGKTALLRQWTEESDRPAAWLALDDPDAEPEVLADSIAAALVAVGIGSGVERSFVLVLDDAHRVPPAVLEETILDLLGWLPAGSQLAVASRCELPLPLARMRTQRILVEMHAEDLAMSAIEAASLLRQAGLDLESPTVQSLVRHTEGWPAALELAAVACLPARDPSLLRGDDHLVADYFRTEVLDSLSPETLRFLLHSSVLDRLSGSLCDEVLGRTGSTVVLSELARANVPLRALDASHEWYHLHGLLREMLQTELRRTEPEVRIALHERAGDWYRKAGDVDHAIEHARSGEDLDRTGELLWSHLHEYLADGRRHMVQQWLTGLSPEHVAGRAPLALVAAHSEMTQGSIAAAERWARSAFVGLSQVPGASTPSERAGALIIDAWAARSGAAGMLASAESAYERLPIDSPWRAICCFLAGTGALLTGEEDGAQRWLEEGSTCGAFVAPDATSLSLAQLAVLAMQRDQPDAACDYAWRAATVVQQHGLSDYPISSLAFAVCASADLRAGRFDEAKAAASRCLSLIGLVDESLSWYGAEVRILLARTCLALGDVGGARELLAHASRLGRRAPDAVVFRRWFDDAWNQFDVRAESALAGLATLTTAELRVLRFLPTHFSFQEIAQRLHVSSNTVKTHVHAVYRKLDVSSRSEAVTQATDAGLLGC